MRRTLSCTVWLVILCSVTMAQGSRSSSKSGAGWKTFHGACFDIKYPTQFTARASLPATQVCSQREVKRMSVFFTAPDGGVEFYVYAPMAGVIEDLPEDIKLNAATEEYVERNSETKDKESVLEKRISRTTIRAKDNSYLRSYESQTNTGQNTQFIIGIKYRNQQAYNKYKQAYLTFKKSLAQYWWD
jgi:hypothetical protein